MGMQGRQGMWGGTSREMTDEYAKQKRRRVGGGSTFREGRAGIRPSKKLTNSRKGVRKGLLEENEGKWY